MNTNDSTNEEMMKLLKAIGCDIKDANEPEPEPVIEQEGPIVNHSDITLDGWRERIARVMK